MDNALDNTSLDNLVKELTENDSTEKIVSSLLAFAKNIDIVQRAQFEKILLKLAQQEESQEKKQFIYEVLVSLQATFKKKPLKKELIKTFWNYFDEGKYQQAHLVLEELEQQTLDKNLEKITSLEYMIPVDTDSQHLIAHHLDQEIILLDENFEEFHTIKIPHEGKIEYLYLYSNDELWILLDNSDSNQSIVSYSLSNKAILNEPITVPAEMGKADGITHSHDFIVSYSEHSIYYYDQKSNSWKKWYHTDQTISSIQSIDNNLWVIIDETDLFIFALAGYEGVRERVTLSEEIGKIKGTCVHQRYRGVFGRYHLLLYDRGSTSPFKYYNYQAKILHAAIIDDRIIATIHGNGVFEGRHITDESKLWEIDLGEPFQVIFKLANRIFLLYPQNKIIAFEIQNTKEMKKQLAKKHLETPKPKEDNLPGNPVKRLKSFMGREKILEEITEHPKIHMLIAGNPKVGKTSLLNIIPELLATTSRCCKIDIVELLDTKNNFTEFNKLFFEKCLDQHLLCLKKEFLDGHQGLKLFIQRIKRDKRYCIFGFDNFVVPEGDETYIDQMDTFFIELYSHRDIRLFFVCDKHHMNKVEDYLKNIRNRTTTKREFKKIELTSYPSDEEKSLLRSITGYRDQEISKLKNFSQGFPHLVHLLLHDNLWKDEIESASQTIAQKHPDFIFEYFRDLDAETRLFLMFLFFNRLFEKKIDLKELYNDFPLIEKFFEPPKIEKMLRSIQEYDSSFAVNNFKKKNSDELQFFSLHMNPAPELFFLGARYSKEAHVVDEISHFMRTPNHERAQKILKAIHCLIDTEFESNEITKSLEEKYKDKFFIQRLTALGQQTLSMPLDMYMIITLKPWDKTQSRKQLENLYQTLQTKISRTISAGKNPSLSQKFYTVLMIFHGSKADLIKKEIKGLNRVSIIDTQNMKEILLAPDHKGKTRETIFNQLSIEERSPYTTSGAVQDLFYGRELEIALIRGLPENIGIFGTRTIGKTSLLLKLYRDLNSQGNCKVYLLDCARIDSEKTLLKNLAEKMRIPHNEIGNLDQFRKYVSDKAEKEEKQYIFLLDEVDRLVEYDLEHGEYIFKTFNKMCSETLESGRIAARFVLVGFQQMYKQMKNPGSRLYNFMLFLPLRALDKKSAIELVTKPMKKIHIKWQDEPNDTNYLVDNCSGHPLLLQQACHSLLAILDRKNENKWAIERNDIDGAFDSEPFQRLLMRFYHFPEKAINKKKLTLWQRLKIQKWNIHITRPFQEKLKTDERKLHRLTVLCAVMLVYREKNDRHVFSLTELLEELAKHNIATSPDKMREILDFLCLRGVFRQIGEPSVIYKADREHAGQVETEFEKIKTQKKLQSDALRIDSPEAFEQDDEMRFKSRYEFGVKIFPQLLTRNLDSIENCRKEMDNLAEELGQQSTER